MQGQRWGQVQSRGAAAGVQEAPGEDLRVLGLLLAPSLTTREPASSVTNIVSLVARENLGEGLGPRSGHTSLSLPDPCDSECLVPSVTKSPSLLWDSQRSRDRGPWKALSSWIPPRGTSFIGVSHRVSHEASPGGKEVHLGDPPPTSSSLKTTTKSL